VDTGFSGIRFCDLYIDAFAIKFSEVKRKLHILRQSCVEKIVGIAKAALASDYAWLASQLAKMVSFPSQLYHYTMRQSF
jgi:hypothetical protein